MFFGAVVVTADLQLASPGTCVPVCLAGFLVRFFALHDTRIVYVESVCRTRRLSLTGLLLYPLADRFVVQWPRLQASYPRSEYIGVLM